MENKKISSKTRIEYLDIAKGIGIILVVWAHAKGPYSRYIYQFHMPLFFIISGYLHNDRNSFCQFIRSKIKAIYIPFILCNLASIGLKMWLGWIRWDPKLVLQVLLTLNKDGQFFGATWFLGSLFVVSIAYKFVDESIENTPWKRLLITGGFISMAVVGFEIKFPFMISRTLILGMFYAIGYFVKTYQKEFQSFDLWGSAVVSALVFVVIGHYNSANMGANEYRYPFTFVAGAILATYVVIFVSRVIDKQKRIWVVDKMQKCLCYLGKKSIHIVIWQFVAFRIVILWQLYLNGIPFKKVLEYYPIYDESGYWWIVYTIVGLLVPIFLGNILERFSKCLTVMRKKVSRHFLT